MAFAHAPLDAAALGPVAAKFVGEGAPAKMRKMVATGLAPLPPRDMLVALYQLWTANDDHSDIAGKTVEGLPAAVLDGAFADRSLPPGVLDLLGRKLARNEAALTQIVRHPQVDDETLVAVARVCPESICDILADNETRWLARPAIVTSLYNNRHCRMSLVHRMIELAEREQVELELPAMDEIRQAMRESGPIDPSRDKMFSEVHATEKAVEDEHKALALFGAAQVDDDLELPEFDDSDALELPDFVQDQADSAANPPSPGSPQDQQPASKERRFQTIMQMRPLEKIRTAMLGDKYDRSVLVRDSNKSVAMATIKSPKIRDNEAVAYSANRALPLEVIAYISNRRDWIKLYTVKLNLVQNPKTPMARSMTLLAHLNQGDVQKIARSKNIPSALATAAKRKQQARR
jgi:hypothetical protein